MAETKQAAEDQATATAVTDAPNTARATKETARLTKQIRAFAASHGGSVQCQLAHIGRGRTRIALVGGDGTWGNLVANSFTTAQSAAEQAGAELRDAFDGDMASHVRTGPYEWTRMAGIQVGGRANPGPSGD
ncbi:hypothetical protein [Streptomyces sp. NPDC003077]|uniref:hypothetical protein n=1 Tax=Streptomyces sp. NPDC003077 TaxID=3154443 RepID=UPI0033AC1AB8